MLREKLFSVLIGVLSFLVLAVSPAVAQTCSNSSLSGKYVVAGQGDSYGGMWCGLLGICTDTTNSTMGYIVADGNGNITQAKLFAATNSGVTAVPITGTYTVSDCNTGTISLTSGGQIMTLALDLDAVDSNNLAHAGAALDTDTRSVESFQLSRTVDPTGTQACGAGFSLKGISLSGSSRGTSLSGQKESGAVTLTFNSSGTTFSGVEKISTGSGVATGPFTGTYTINSDCSVMLTKSASGRTIRGVYIISGGDPKAPPFYWMMWQGDSAVSFDPLGLADD